MVAELKRVLQDSNILFAFNLLENQINHVFVRCTALLYLLQKRIRLRSLPDLFPGVYIKGLQPWI